MIFSSLSKNHTHYEQLRISGGRESEEDLLSLVPNYGILFQMNNEYKSITPLADFKAEIKTLVPENCPCTLSKTYFSANRFYLKSDSHVPKNFSQIKLFPSYVRKNTIICLFGK